jgi:hypothetical protein
MNIGIILAALGVGAVALLSRKKAQAGDQAFMDQVYGPTSPQPVAPISSKPATPSRTEGYTTKTVVLFGDGSVAPGLVKGLQEQRFEVIPAAVWANRDKKLETLEAAARLRDKAPERMLFLVAGSPRWDSVDTYVAKTLDVLRMLEAQNPSRKKWPARQRWPAVLVLATPDTERATASKVAALNDVLAPKGLQGPQRQVYQLVLSSLDKAGTYTPTPKELSVILSKFKI